MRRIIAVGLAALSAVGVVTLTSGCGMPVQATYAPAAYGVPGHCYYEYSPLEVTALQDAGLCPRSWVATPAPLAWEEEYYSYYDSPAYYGTYVPVRYRTVYVSRETTFGRTYHSRIVTLSRSATYRSSSGGTVKGTAVTSKTRFGSGTSFGTGGQRYGGGSRSVTGHTGTARTTHVSSRR